MTCPGLTVTKTVSRSYRCFICTKNHVVEKV